MNDEQATPRRRVIRRYSAEDRKRLIGEFKGSGLTAQAFCKQAGIHPTTLSGWIRTAVEADFTEVQMPAASVAPIEVDLPNGVKIRVRTTGDVSRTADLIRAVAAPLGGGSGC